MANLSVFSIVAFGMMILECIFSIITLSTTHWGEVDESQTGSETNSRQVRGHWGFFEICRTYEYENTGETSETCTSTDDENFSDYWKYSFAFEILAFITSLMVLPVWLIWIFRAKSADVWPVSTLLKATTVVMLYVTAFFHGLAAGIWNIHKVGPYDSDVLEFEIGWSWALAIFCVVWAAHGIFPVMFSQLSDKDVDGDPVWFYPPSFIAETRKRNVFYRSCATLCLGMPFSKDYSELFDQESGHRVAVMASSSRSSSVDEDLKKPHVTPEDNDEKGDLNKMRCDANDDEKAPRNDVPPKHGHNDEKLSKDEGNDKIQFEPVAIEEAPKSDEASTTQEPQVTESTPTHPPSLPQQSQDPAPTVTPVPINAKKVESKAAPPVTKDDYKSKQIKGEKANSKLKTIKKKRQEAKKDEKSQGENSITDVDI